MGRIEIYQVITKESAACGIQKEWKPIFKYEVEGSLTDRVTIHPGKHGGIDVVVNTSKENAVYSLPGFKEIMATVGGLVEIYFTGDYAREPF